MTSIVPIRVNDSWVNIAGCQDSPRFLFIVDIVAKDAILDLAAVGVDSRDVVVQIRKGDFDTLESFIRSRSRDYATVEAVVILWYGAEELVQEAPPPGSLAPQVEEWFLPQGPRIMPRLTVSEVVSKYTDSVRLSLGAFPQSLVISTDPPPRRSSGFATARANYVGKSMRQQDGRHHHFLLNRHFHGRQGSNFNEGGKYPLHESFFIGGVVPTLAAWSAVFRRVYAALAAVSVDGDVDRDAKASLKLIKTVF